MRNKRLIRTLSTLCLTLVLVSGFTVPAFAQGAAPPPAEDTTNDSNVVVEETEKAPPLTPDGNAALVDDFGGNKQLITVTTKAGNYFYILIDRANEDKKTAVHFLNVQMVRALHMTPVQLSAMLSGGTVPGSLANDNNEQEGNSYEE